MGYIQCKFDKCEFYNGQRVFFVYTNNSITMDPYPCVGHTRVVKLQIEFTIEIYGDFQDYVGIQILQEPDGYTKLTKTQSMDSILQDLEFFYK